MELAGELVKLHMTRRLQNTNISKEVRLNLESDKCSTHARKEQIMFKLASQTEEKDISFVLHVPEADLQ
nr:unnamed protein product [Callosobruchus analis]